MTILLVSIFIMKFKRWKAERRLKLQQALSSSGVGLRTEILDIEEKASSVKNGKMLRIRTKLRVNGKIVNRWVHIILNGEEKLQAGDKVLIRYNPYRLGYVLLCGKTG